MGIIFMSSEHASTLQMAWYEAKIMSEGLFYTLHIHQKNIRSHFVFCSYPKAGMSLYITQDIWLMQTAHLIL